MTSSTARANATRRVALVVATPAYDGKVLTDYVRSLIDTLALLNSQGVACGWNTLDRQSLIQAARNTLVAQFLAIPKATHLLFIDADIVWKPEDVLRLLQHGLDVVCGVYSPKRDDMEWPLACGPLAGSGPTIDPRTGCVEMTTVGAGFLMIKRQVFLRLIEAYPQSRLHGTPRVAPNILPWMHDFFPCLVHESGQLLSEIDGFCWRWREIGGQIFADPDIRLAHWGDRPFTSSLREVMPADTGGACDPPAVEAAE